ncbi:MAG: DUF3341 domain-containing protein, partial [Phycisphaerales bacterium]
DEPGKRPLLILGGHDFASVTEKVCSITERPRPPRAWYVAFGLSSGLTAVLFAMIGYLFLTGVGVWGVNNPVGWGWAIVNFVFWVGIGHAGTLISAILFLFRQKWRTSINRFAEAMTIFAVVCALIFPGIHVGRVWVAYWMAPYPNQMQMWPNFRSPLLWDVFAVGTYGVVSAMFWFMGMVPDLSTLRDRATTRIRQIAYGILALGWRSSNRHWLRYERAYLLLAALAAPLVLSVHSVVSFDFAVSQVPGWHTTIFAPYFVAGAIFSGFAMVMTLIIPARQFFGLEEIITLRHLENMSKIILVTGMMVGYSYMIEFFIAWYGGNPYEAFAFVSRALGPYAWAYWIMISCNVLAPQLFWVKKCRTNVWILMIVCVLVNIGMWFERFVITVTSLSSDFLPSSWGYYSPTWVDALTLLGSFGLFSTLFLLFIRYLPIVAMAEVKSVMPQAQLDRGIHRGLGDYWGDMPHIHDEQPGEPSREQAVSPAHRTSERPADTKAESYSYLVDFETAGDLIAGAERVRDAGYTQWDAHAPFPVHGLNDAMGLSATRLPWLVFFAGLTGAGVGLGLQYFTNAVDYPLVISGKPFFSLPANIPITFELTILFAATAAFVGMLAFNRLPQHYHALFKSRRFRKATTNRFFISVEARDPCFDRVRTKALLESLGGSSVEEIGE